MIFVALLLILLKSIVAVQNEYFPCPDLCRCDWSSSPRRVDCSSLGLTEFPENIHVATQYLDLSNNNISILPTDIGKIVPQLEFLVLHHNSIETIATENIKSLTELRFLDLSHNLLQSPLGENLVSQNPRLLELRLNNNNLTNTGSLRSSTLEILTVNNCNISKISNIQFQNLPSLRMLNISNNPILRLPDDLKSPNLRVIDVTSCKLISLSSSVIKALPKLQYFHISGNSHLDLPRAPALISKSLLQLTADHCNIQHPSLTNLPALTHAYLSHNKIATIKAEHFARNAALLEIDLRQNLIRDIAVDVFKNAINLISVDLSNNQIENLEKNSFSCCTELKYLNLSRNNIPRLPDSINIPSVEILDLSRSRLEAIPSNKDFFQGMTQLKRLYLQHNEIRNVPNLISDSLRYLDLSYCYIAQIQNTTFKHLNELQVLDLSGNKLTTLDSDVFDYNNKLGQLHLEDNPWKCNCSDREFQKLYALSSKLSIKGQEKLYCNDPENMKGKTWTHACLVETEDDSTNQWLLTLALFSTLILICGIVVCTRGLVGGRKRMQQARTELSREQRQTRDSTQNNVTIYRNNINVGSSENSPRRHVESLPPSYEEALLMTRSTSEIATVNTNVDIVVESCDGERRSIHEEDEEIIIEHHNGSIDSIHSYQSSVHQRNEEDVSDNNEEQKDESDEFHNDHTETRVKSIRLQTEL